LEPRDRSRGKYLIKLKNRVRERLAWFEERGAARGEREVVARDLERVRAHLEDPGNLPPGRGVAIFACEPLGLFEAVPLPRVFRSRLAVDRSPLIRELAAVDDEFGMVLCAVCDRTGSRFFEVSAFGAEELPGLAVDDATRAARFHGAAAPRGSAGEHRYHQRIREEKQRHYAATADQLFELARGRAARGIVLAGMGADADAVRPHLHPYLARQVLGVTRLNPKTATATEVMDAVLQVRYDSERTWEAEAVAALAERLGSGWAVNGIDGVLSALAQGQVRTLLVDPTVEAVGYRCADTGRLQASPEGCRGEGDPEAIPDVVDEAIEDALRLGGHVQVVEDEDARTQLKGLAALLRFRAS
jgi:peptide chain release factor subunit 1